MNQHSRQHHVIDAIFPIAIFFVFTASLLIVLLLAARIYSKTTIDSDKHFTDRTAFAYVMEKVRQNDTDGALSVQTIDGTRLPYTYNFNRYRYNHYLYLCE